MDWINIEIRTDCILFDLKICWIETLSINVVKIENEFVYPACIIIEIPEFKQELIL